MQRNTIKAKKPKKPRAERRRTIAFEKYENNPSAIVEKKFVAEPGSVVYAWRTRAGQKPSWYECDVVRVSDDYVELWDKDAGQWFCFDPSAQETPDVRLSS